MPKVLKADGMNKCIGCFTCMLVCSGVNHQNHSLIKSAIKIKTSGGLKGKFASTVCIACKEDIACEQACPAGALVKRPGGGVLLKPEKCIGCRRCVDACIINAVFFDQDEKKPIICKHCSMCTKYCPHNCLRMEDVENDV